MLLTRSSQKPVSQAGLAGVLGVGLEQQQGLWLHWGVQKAEGLWEGHFEHRWVGGSQRARWKMTSAQPLSCKAFLSHPPWPQKDWSAGNRALDCSGPSLLA